MPEYPLRAIRGGAEDAEIHALQTGFLVPREPPGDLADQGVNPISRIGDLPGNERHAIPKRDGLPAM